MAVFKALQEVATKGQSTLIMADCLRELVSIINEPEEEAKADD